MKEQNLPQMPSVTADISDDVAKLQRTIISLTERLEQVENRQLLNKPILTLNEAALFLGVKPSQLYKLTHERAIPFSKPNGKKCYFDRDELIEWARQGRSMTKSEINAAAQSKLEDLAQG